MLSVLAFSASAAEYIYIDSVNGVDKDTGGSADEPVKTFTYAYALADKRGADMAVIVFTNEYSMPSTVTEKAHDFPITLTTNDGRTDYSKDGAKLVFGKNLRYVLNGDTTFENITVEYSGTLNCVAQYNAITFGENVTTKRLDSESSGLYVVGGFQAPTDQVDVTLDSHITIKSGDFLNVIGGSRDKADGASGSMYKMCTFTGTHYIDISGGYIKNFYGASARAQYSHSAVITMSGGKVDNFSVGGDNSRRLNGDAKATFTGGEIGKLNVNNIIGNGDIYLLGTKVGEVSIWCFNEEVTKLEAIANNPKALYYDANYYTTEEIDKFSKYFDKIENIAKLYAADGASGSGASKDDAASFAEAFKKAAETGSVIYAVGEIKLDSFTEPAHAKKVTVCGFDKAAKLTLGGTYTLAGETAFESIALCGNGTFDAKGGYIEVAADATVSGTLSVKGSAALYGGSFESVTDTENLFVNGATVKNAVCTGNAAVEVASGSIGTLDIAANELTLTIGEGKIGAYTVSNTGAVGTLVVPDSFDTSTLGAAAAIFKVSSEKVYFLRDGGSGSGSSLQNAGGSLADAYAALESGGTVVVCGEYNIGQSFVDHNHSGKITITSVYGGVDYAKEAGAKIIFSANFYCGGETEFCDITLISNGNYISIYANCHSLILGNNITTDKRVGATFMSVMGGNQKAGMDTQSNLTINSGKWQRVRGGTAASGSTGSKVNFTVNGGEFVERVTLGSSSSHSGDINSTINGGTFLQGIYAATVSDSNMYSGNVTLTINGGKFYNIIGANSSKAGTFNGNFNVVINGGEFAHLVELNGTEGLSGNASSTIVSAVDIGAKEIGTYTFTSPIRNDGADPWLFYHNGYYYYTATMSTSSVKLVRATNFGDLINYGGTTIYTPEKGKVWSDSTWSPTLLRYTDEEVGAGNGGWYLYFGGAGEGHSYRMYVLKCLDGDNILGRWGNPITGEINNPEPVSAPDISNFDEKWAAGQGDIRIDGKLYVLYVTEELPDTPDHYQTINIIPMTNPWTFEGESSVICYPTEPWEMGGHRTNPVTGQTTPKTVECASPLYAEDGTVYITYSGSNYTSKEYCVAYLKFLGGDPLDINNWEKCDAPIISQSELVSGTGSACNIVDTAGQGWIIYNAYEGKDTSGARHAMIEPYVADKNGIVVGDGSGKAAIGGSVYTAALNPMPLIEKTSGFTKIEYEESAFKAVREYDNRFTDVSDLHWFASYVKNAYELGLANGTSAAKFSPDSSFTVAQALTAAANIHTAYNGTSVRVANSGEQWYVPYVEYCVQNGIITGGQFADYNANITRGDMAIVFANILPGSEYSAKKEGAPADVTSSMDCYGAVEKLFKAGIVSGDSGSGNYRPADSIKRSEACVIFTRIAIKSARA